MPFLLFDMLLHHSCERGGLFLPDTDIFIRVSSERGGRFFCDIDILLRVSFVIGGGGGLPRCATDILRRASSVCLRHLFPSAAFLICSAECFLPICVHLLHKSL